MTQSERLDYLVGYLIKENPRYKALTSIKEEAEKKNLLRSLMNVRAPMPIADEFLRIQDDYLQEENRKDGVVSIDDLVPIKGQLYLYQGDITRLKVDAIVNAANSAMLGCFIPCHSCIDNIIHSKAGIELRLECNRIMKMQGHEEITGEAKITKAYNLPSRFIIHTVGPIVQGKPTAQDKYLLSSCYESCLSLADKHNLRTIAFCCISTGVFHFPNELAAEIAIKTVEAYLERTGSKIEVIFNVFKDIDREIYQRLLG